MVSRENAALTNEVQTSIQPEESPPGDEQECSFKTLPRWGPRLVTT